jgi:hypothetical protein
VALDHAVSSAHGFTVDRAKGYLPCLDLSSPRAIERPWCPARGCGDERGGGGGARRRLAGSSPVTLKTSVQPQF